MAEPNCCGFCIGLRRVSGLRLDDDKGFSEDEGAFATLRRLGFFGRFGAGRLIGNGLSIMI